MNTIQQVLQRKVYEIEAILTDKELIQQTEIFIQEMCKAVRLEKTIFICGNGGSAADASHFVAELMGRFSVDRDPIPAISLACENACVTGIANDFDYDKTFARQLKGLGKNNDVLIVLSTSGNSRNIVEVLRTAKEMGIKTYGILGKGGGMAKDLVDLGINVQHEDTATIQEIYMILLHTLVTYIDKVFYQ